MNLSKPSDQVSHLAIVMDGNQRWARSKGLPGPEGHKEGAKAVKNIVRAAAKKGVQYLTLFAFSSENWRRPDHEVDLLMQLFYVSIEEQLPELQLNKVKLVFIGDLLSFSSTLQTKMADAVLQTSANTGMQLNIAVNYGGQWDISQAAKSLLKQCAQNENSLSEVMAKFEQSSESDLAHHLCLGTAPPVDLFIRTSGEQRISNFLLWQLAYAELYFTPLYWPDFDDFALQQALDSFAQRQRRFGQSSEELNAMSTEVHPTL